jgi:hypothetical protein
MTGDSENNTGSGRFAGLPAIGQGQFIARRCWQCNQNKSSEGGKMRRRGSLSIFTCAACVATPKEEATK